MTVILDITVRELCEYEDIEESLVIAAVEHRIVTPRAPAERSASAAAQWRLPASEVTWLRRALRLRRDLEIDWVAVATIIDLVRRNEQLQQENRRLQQRLQRFMAGD